MKCVENREKHSPQRGRVELLDMWSEDEDGSHLSNQSYYNRNDSPAPSCMAGGVDLYQRRCTEKYLPEKST